MVFGNDPAILKIRDLFREVSEKYGVSEEDIFYEVIDYKIPIKLYDTKLSTFEIISKYLIENKRLTHSQIAKLTGRSRQGVYQAYKHACKKYPSGFVSQPSKYDLPISIFSSKSPFLESVVKYLHEKFDLNFSEISRLIDRDSRTIWTVYSRAKKK